MAFFTRRGGTADEDVIATDLDTGVGADSPLPGPIPKIIHRIWLGAEPMPQAFHDYGETWKRLHPGWQHVLWTDETLPALANQAEFDRATSYSHKKDIARYEILLLHGGVYVDCDFEALKPLDDLLDGLQGFSATEDGVHVGNAIMGCRPGHPFWLELVRGIPGSAIVQADAPANVATGPEYVSKVAWRRLDRGEDPITVFPAESFYPYNWRELDRRGDRFPEAYAVHHWFSLRDRAGSWRTDEQFAHDDFVARRQRSSRQEVFTEIFEEGSWGSEESVSGPGSTLALTFELSQRLVTLVRDLQVSTLLDVPCGDLTWMGPLLDRGLVDRYYGADVVEPLLDQVRRQWAGDRREFLLLDVARDALPVSDAVLCRDLLAHLTLPDALAALLNIASSGCRWVLTTTYPGRVRNPELEFTGGYRPLNLTEPPFNLPNPTRLVPEGAPGSEEHPRDKCLGVWSSEAVLAALRPHAAAAPHQGTT